MVPLVIYYAVLAFQFSAISTLIVNTVTGNANYTGHQLMRVVPINEADVTFLLQLSRHSEKLEINFWTYPNSPQKPVDIHVSPESYQLFRKEFNSRGMPNSIIINDIQRLINQQTRFEDERRSYNIDSYDYGQYHGYEEMVEELRKLNYKHSNITTLINLGQTYEGRDMFAIHISLDPEAGRPIVFIQCGIHAREWISPATCMFFINEVLNNFTVPGKYKDMLSKYTLVVLPIINIDGYEYSRSPDGDRLWRKTRSYHKKCIGVDANRNWDYLFATPGASDNPCHEVYHGERAFSEIEVFNVASYLIKIKDRLVAYFDLHSYGQYWLTPWGHTLTLPTDYEEIERVALIGVKSLSGVYNTTFKCGPPSALLYTVSGSCIDWSYGYLGIRYSYSIELRDQGKYGFLLPSNQIKPTAIETSAGLLAAILAIN